MRWVLLLRAVNLGPTNKLAMQDLTRVLEGQGLTDVRTYLNSGNATFTSPKRSATSLADGIARALKAELALDVGVCVRRDTELAKALEELPPLPGYASVTVLFDKPPAEALTDFLARDWSPEQVTGNDQVLFIGFQNAARTKLTLARIEKLLGVAATARTPNTLRALLSRHQGPR